MLELNFLKQQYDEQAKRLKSVQAELAKMPAGELNICKTNSGMLYRNRVRIDGKVTLQGLNRNTDMVYLLAHKRYLEELESRLAGNVKVLMQASKVFKDMDYNSIAQCFPKNFLSLDQRRIINPDSNNAGSGMPNPVGDGSVSPIYLNPNFTNMMKMAYPKDWTRITPEVWAGMPYCENTSYSQFKTHLACNGLKTRSKSESMILEQYSKRKIFYHYDELFRLDTFEISPDFVWINSDGNVIIHEHAGVWTRNYLEKNERKLRLYEKYGFVMGRNLILSFDDENGNINLELIGTMIDAMNK